MHNLLKKQLDAQLMTGQCKEVEEWLMGSGESAETAASQAMRPNQNFKIVGGKPMQQVDSEAAEDPKEDWMFKTFSKVVKVPTS